MVIGGRTMKLVMEIWEKVYDSIEKCKKKR